MAALRVGRQECAQRPRPGGIRRTEGDLIMIMIAKCEARCQEFVACVRPHLPFNTSKTRQP